jgi:hypothetical protein
MGTMLELPLLEQVVGPLLRVRGQTIRPAQWGHFHARPHIVMSGQHLIHQRSIGCGRCRDNKRGPKKK